jgi:glyoxylate/hydroxypyruvate reductase A
LPPVHPFWKHPKISVTPHTSARTLRAESIAQITGKIQALHSGAAIASIAGVVDTKKGY